ncbi:E1 ubiquitin-activating protein [Balamuthia mandrillaris]
MQQGGKEEEAHEQRQRQRFENEWSRLIPALGHGGEATLRKLQSSSVLLLGLKGLGLEIAKNLVLMGVRHLALYDDENVQPSDLSSQFYLSEANIGQNRAEATLPKLAQLNGRVQLNLITEDLHNSKDDDVLASFQVIVATNNRSLTLLKELSKRCRERKTQKLIVAESFGLFGTVFVDLGEEKPEEKREERQEETTKGEREWVVLDVNGEPPKSGYVESITQDEEGLVTVWDEKLHDLEDGDVVTFTGVEGMHELNDSQWRITVKSPYQFSIGDTRAFHTYAKGGQFTEMKKALRLTYKSFEDMLKERPRVYCAADTAFTNADPFQCVHYHLLFQALLSFRETHNGALPNSHDENHIQEVIALINEINEGFGDDQPEQLNEELLRHIISVSCGDISPMAAVLGGIVAQEVIKACTQKFTPIRQWFFFDASECLPKHHSSAPEEYISQGTRYDGQTAIFGRSFQETLLRLKYFLAGAGAIGCEMLKNWAMMGVGASQDGIVHVTDIDTIEISNLNRQFLFREHDLSKSKSKVARVAALEMNPNMQIKAWTVKVAPETEGTFGESFWKALDGVTTALDNVAARRYLDSKCVFYGKPMLDSGTQGTKGNVQVVIPHLTQAYSSSSDPPQREVPVCLLHQFPHDIQHCMQWAREVIFEGPFGEEPDIVNNWLDRPDYLQTLAPTNRVSALRTLRSCIIEKPKDFEDCVLWARGQYEKWYHHKLRQLLEVYPLDHTDENGTPFWSGGKLPPKIMAFDPDNDEQLTFVTAAAFLRAYTFGLVPDEFKPENLDQQKQKICNIIQEMYIPAPYQHAQEQQESQSTQQQQEHNTEEDEHNMLKDLPPRESLGEWRMRHVTFEKDDDRNFHVDLVWAAANLRARAYGIRPVPRLEAKLISGRIIPAIVTTTAIVAGLVCLELYKLVQRQRKKEEEKQEKEEMPLSVFRDTFINLANLIFQQAEPLPPQKHPFVDGKEVTEWDFLDIRRGDLTLKEFIYVMKGRYKLTVDSVLCGTAPLYMSYGMSQEKATERIPKKLSELVREVGGMVLTPKQSVFQLAVSADDENGNEVDHIPNVRIWYKTKPPAKKTTGETKKRRKDDDAAACSSQK